MAPSMKLVVGGKHWTTYTNFACTSFASRCGSQLFCVNVRLWFVWYVSCTLCDTLMHSSFDSKQSGESPFGKIRIDGANGIGALKVKKMLVDCGLVDAVTVYNDGSKGILNHKVFHHR